MKLIFRLFQLLLMGLLLGNVFNTGAMEMQVAASDQVTLVSAEGKEFLLPLRVAKRSGTIAGLLEMPGQSQRLAFERIDTRSLDYLVKMLVKLDDLLQKNEIALARRNLGTKSNQIYIPRAYQPYVNELLQRAENEDLGNLYQAADFFDIPFILNAVACVIADRIHSGIKGLRVKNEIVKWNQLNQSQRRKLVEEVMRGINTPNIDYIFKHVTLRKQGILQEYSIADYIAQHREPRLTWQHYEKMQGIELGNEKLTSLYGIKSLQDAKEAKMLLLYNNCFFDLSLDPQGAEHPFEHFENLMLFNFASNGLIRLPGDLFAGLRNLRSLDLHGNDFNELPVELFKDLNQLRVLILDGDDFSEEEKQRIRNTLPKVYVQFESRI